MLRKSLFSLLLITFFLFLGVGNLFRLMESSLFSDNLILSEAFLYLLSFLSLFFVKLPTKLLGKICLFSGLICLSFLYGCSLQGFDLHASLYALRLIFLLVSLVVISEVCFERFKGDVRAFFHFLFKSYLLSFLLGALLYLFFLRQRGYGFFLGSTM